tara:strand:- start:659 stop:916 length:258 start_codon:yes stop_codon:yes gene_type:complete
MKSKLIISIIYIILFITPSYSNDMDCDQFEKLSAKYVECNTKKLKENTKKQVNIGKKKFDNSTLKEKLIKFKNSKNLMDFLDKDK